MLYITVKGYLLIIASTSWMLTILSSFPFSHNYPIQAYPPVCTLLLEDPPFLDRSEGLIGPEGTSHLFLLPNIPQA